MLLGTDLARNMESIHGFGDTDPGSVQGDDDMWAVFVATMHKRAKRGLAKRIIGSTQIRSDEDGAAAVRRRALELHEYIPEHLGWSV